MAWHSIAALVIFMKGYKKVGLGIVAAAAAYLLADAWFLTKYFFQVKRYSIGKADGQKKIRILLLSDLHFKKRLWPFHHRLARKINSLHPDLILMTGDLIDEFGRPEPARQFLRLLKASLPLVAIPGNHDNKNKVSRHTLRKLIEQRKGRLLVNETIQIFTDNIPITITGLDDFIESESCFPDAVRNTGKEEHHLLLVHSPLQQEVALKEMKSINNRRTPDRQLHIQYIFAGHTHGGQVRLGDFIPFLPEKAGGYVDGWYNEEKPFLYVSRGFGTSAVPFRFGKRAEVTVLEYGV